MSLNKEAQQRGKKYMEKTVEATKEVRLTELQWKLLHNIYPTNILLSKMRVRENNKCTYCPWEIDYIEHFFNDCAFVKKILEMDGGENSTTCIYFSEILSYRHYIWLAAG